MTSSEILRNLADVLDKIGGAAGPTDATDQHLSDTMNANVDNAEKAAEAKENLGDFVPPLQQKLELLKKSVGVDNMYDEDTETDELSIIKKNAGINPNTTAIMTLADDEPLDM